jgi:hypothetical protein
MKNQLLIISLILCSFNSFAKDWGHLVTGTTDTLKKNEYTVGTQIAGVGLTDQVTFGAIPMAYLGYDFFAFSSRIRLIEKEKYQLVTDLMYFDSMESKKTESNFDQTSWYMRVNNSYHFNKTLTLYLSAGFQYFIHENSTYSLRSDPQGKNYSFMVKTFPEEYELKIEDYKINPRDLKTLSLTVMPSIRLSEITFINLEYGYLGLNYDYPLTHIGASLNFSWKRVDLGLGASRSSRTTPFIGTEELFHTETKLQLYF